MERIVIAMQDGGAGREANLILSCRRTSMGTPR